MSPRAGRDRSLIFSQDVCDTCNVLTYPSVLYPTKQSLTKPECKNHTLHALLTIIGMMEQLDITLEGDCDRNTQDPYSPAASSEWWVGCLME